jgi:hypothetical protein
MVQVLRQGLITPSIWVMDAVVADLSDRDAVRRVAALRVKRVQPHVLRSSCPVCTV